jgi:ribosomal protein S18 acetylase RimI-like enzyme
MSQSARPSIRRARPSDADAILALEVKSFHRAQEQFGRRQIVYLIRRARAVVLVAQRGEALVGWVAALLRQPPVSNRPTARIYALAVDPAARGLRIGRLLMQAILRRLSRSGVRRTSLEVRSDNSPAIHLYARFGFAHTRRLPHYYARHVHAVRMLRQIPSRSHPVEARR